MKKPIALIILALTFLNSTVGHSEDTVSDSELARRAMELAIEVGIQRPTLRILAPNPKYRSNNIIVGTAGMRVDEYTKAHDGIGANGQTLWVQLDGAANSLCEKCIYWYSETIGEILDPKLSPVQRYHFSSIYLPLGEPYTKEKVSKLSETAGLQRKLILSIFEDPKRYPNVHKLFLEQDRQYDLKKYLASHFYVRVLPGSGPPKFDHTVTGRFRITIHAGELAYEYEIEAEAGRLLNAKKKGSDPKPEAKSTPDQPDPSKAENDKLKDKNEELSKLVAAQAAELQKLKDTQNAPKAPELPAEFNISVRSSEKENPEKAKPTEVNVIDGKAVIAK